MPEICRWEALAFTKRKARIQQTYSPEGQAVESEVGGLEKEYIKG